jgi:hypothetical protein
MVQNSISQGLNLSHCRIEFSFETAYKAKYHTKIHPKGYQNILSEN